MRNYLPFLVLLLLSGSLFAQHPTCDGNRYSNFVFPALDSTMDVKFGENTTFNNVNQELFMNIYEPAGDNAAMRPAILFAYGGAFIGGQRDDVAFLCRYFASKGYVTVNFDYRLYDNGLFTDSTQAVDAVIKAVADMKAAVRFLREDAATANNYRIDPDYIYGGGISAGAITSLHVAYLDSNDNVDPDILNIINQNGGWEGNTSSNTQYSSSIRGVLNYSGALKDVNWMDANEAIVYSAHDNGDNVVPYNSRSVLVGFGVTIYLEGSETITTQANALGINNNSFTVNTSGHVTYFNTTNGTQVLNESTDLFFSDVCAGTVDALIPETPGVSIFPNPAQTELAIRFNYETGFSMEIFDLSGRLVHFEESDHADLRTNIETLLPGMYMVRLRTEDGLVMQHKLMVQ